MNPMWQRLRTWLDPRYVRRRLAHNFWLKASSTAFAVGLWEFVNLGATDAEKGLLVALEWRNLPEGMTINSPLADAVSVRVRGPRTILGSIGERGEKILIDLASVRPGATTFKIDPELLSLPRGVRVTGISPAEVTLDIERVVARVLPVAVNLASLVSNGFRLGENEVRPSTVLVTGPASEVEALKNVPTEPLRPAAGVGAFEQTVALERPAESLRLVPDRVAVRGRIEEVMVSTEYRGIEVTVRNARSPVRLKPAVADVLVRGPQRLLSGFKPSAETLWVDVATLQRGSREVTIEVTLPDGLTAGEVHPPRLVASVMAQPPARRAR